MQFVFLCNPPKSGTSEVCIIFTQITQKIPTKDKIYWLELITEILKLSTNIQCEKNNHPAYLIFQKICKKVNKKLIFLTYFGPLKLQIILSVTYIHCFFLTLINVSCMFSTIHPHLSLFFSHLVFLFSPSFSCHETILQFTMFDSISLKLARNITQIKNFIIHDEKKVLR